jgi:hypothetical protein
LTTGNPEGSERLDRPVLRFLVQDLKREDDINMSQEAKRHWNYEERAGARRATAAYAWVVGSVSWEEGGKLEWDTPRLRDLRACSNAAINQWHRADKILTLKDFEDFMEKLDWMTRDKEGMRLIDDIYQQCVQHGYRRARASMRAPRLKPMPATVSSRM